MENKWYTSSTGSGVSLTLKGIFTALVPLGMLIIKQYNLEITETQVWDVLNAIIALVSGVMIVYGAIRRYKNS